MKKFALIRHENYSCRRIFIAFFWSFSSINDKKVKKKLDEGRRIIMIFSNLDNPVRSDSTELKKIIQGFKENNLELHFV